MGGGGGFNPISIITDMVFGQGAGTLLTGILGGGAPEQGGVSSGADPQAEANRLAEEQAAQARRAEDRRAEEAQLKAARRQSLAAVSALGSSEGNNLGGVDNLGAPNLQRANLKEKLGQ